jgi:hypothetical protein
VEEWIVKEVLDRLTCVQSELTRLASELFNITISQQSVSLILAKMGVAKRKRRLLKVQNSTKKLERHVEFHEQLVDVPET